MKIRKRYVYMCCLFCAACAASRLLTTTPRPAATRSLTSCTRNCCRRFLWPPARCPSFRPSRSSVRHPTRPPWPPMPMPMPMPTMLRLTTAASPLQAPLSGAPETGPLVLSQVRRPHAHAHAATGRVVSCRAEWCRGYRYTTPSANLFLAASCSTQSLLARPCSTTFCSRDVMFVSEYWEPSLAVSFLFFSFLSFSSHQGACGRRRGRPRWLHGVHDGARAAGARQAAGAGVVCYHCIYVLGGVLLHLLGGWPSHVPRRPRMGGWMDP